MSESDSFRNDSFMNQSHPVVDSLNQRFGSLEEDMIISKHMMKNTSHMSCFL